VDAGAAYDELVQSPGQDERAGHAKAGALRSCRWRGKGAHLDDLLGYPARHLADDDALATHDAAGRKLPIRGGIGRGGLEHHEQSGLRQALCRGKAVAPALLVPIHLLRFTGIAIARANAVPLLMT
jgi:hypothetical protein